MNPIEWIKHQLANSDEEIVAGRCRGPTLSADIIRWVEMHFSDADRPLAMEMLIDAASVGYPPPSPRLLRCVTLLSGGDIERLRSAIGSMRQDWRDVISWAEYEERDGKRIHARDLNRPLALD